MKLGAILCLALAACGGPRHRPDSGQPPPREAAGSAAVPVTPAELAPPPDPTKEARLAYSNPGGMWMPQQMTLPVHVEAFKQLGVELPAQSLADPAAAPLDAVVWLGGCTGSFVSAEGLIVTNHHCVQQALQVNTSKKDGKNAVEDGFLARSKADEPSAGPGVRVYVAQAFKDVTREMRDGLDKIKDPVARKQASEQHLKALLAACEKDRPGIRCQIRGYFNGAQYIQAENLELRDVRLVYAPPRSVGDYGGEVDNWHWPRHTGDWSFYRAYVGKDGQPADYAPDNVPYQPKSHLQIATSPLSAGDFVMIMGYPGSTQRTRPAAATHHQLAWELPYAIDYAKQRYAIAEAHLADPGETGTKATVLKQFVQNGLAKSEGILAALGKSQQLIAKKDALDQQIKDWAARPGNEANKRALDKLEQLGAEERKTARADFDRRQVFDSSRLLAAAISITHWADERVKPDAARRAGYQDRDLAPAVAVQKQLAKTYDRTLDRALFRLALVRAAQLPAADRPWLATLLDAPRGKPLDEAAIDKILDGWYASPALEDDALRLALLQSGSLAKLRASKDPMIKAALRAWPTVKADENKSDTRQGELLLVGSAYVEGMKEVLGGQLAPDANFTLRISYGTVRSFNPSSSAPADAPFTYASQILTKDTGKEPFNAPAKLLAAIRAKDFGRYADSHHDLPVDFLTDLDTTGGNSGSPIVNQRGQLVGLEFDSTLEGIQSDIVFNPDTARGVGVDVRYLLWNLEKIADGGRLLQEMGVTPAASAAR